MHRWSHSNWLQRVKSCKTRSCRGGNKSIQQKADSRLDVSSFLCWTYFQLIPITVLSKVSSSSWPPFFHRWRVPPWWQSHGRLLVPARRATDVLYHLARSIALHRTHDVFCSDASFCFCPGPFSGLSYVGFQLRLYFQNKQNMSQTPEALWKR